MPPKIKKTQIAGWWIRHTRTKSHIDKQVEAWKTECGELLTRCQSLIQEFDAMFKVVANPKLKRRYLSRGYGARLSALRERVTHGKDTSLSPSVRYGILHDVRLKLKALIKELETYYEALQKEGSSKKYVFRSYSLPLVTPEFAAQVNDIIAETGVVIHPSDAEVFVALRSSSRDDLDLTAEWDAIDKPLIAAQDVDLDPYRQFILEEADTLCDRFRSALRADDIAQARASACLTFCHKLKSRSASASSLVCSGIYREMSTTELIKHHAHIQHQVIVKKAAYATVMSIMAGARIVGSGGLDAWAYYAAARSIVSLSSIALREALTDLDSTWKVVKGDIKEIDAGIKKGSEILKGVDRRNVVLNKLFRSLTGSSVSLDLASLAVYKDHHLQFSARLAEAQRRIATEANRITAAYADLQAQIDTWKADMQGATDPDARDALIRESSQLLKHKIELEEEWAPVKAELDQLIKEYRTTFTTVLKKFKAYENLVTGMGVQDLDHGVSLRVDFVPATMRAIYTYDTVADLADLDTVDQLLVKGVERLVDLVL